MERRKRYHESILVWEKLFGQGNAGKNFVKIPENWIHFSLTALASTDNFSWAKEFLSSGAASLLQDHCGNVSLLPLPTACPHQKSSSSLSIIELHDDHIEPNKAGHLESTMKLNPNKEEYVENTMELNPPTPREGSKKKRTNKRTTPIVDNQVRRSDRLKQGTNGFKTSECSN
jgi:hypothetical protein